MSIRSPRSPSRRSGSLSLPLAPPLPLAGLSPPPMPPPRPRGGGNSNISSPMPLPPIPVAYPDFSVAGPSRAVGTAFVEQASEYMRTPQRDMGEEVGREERRMRRRSRKDLRDARDSKKGGEVGEQEMSFVLPIRVLGDGVDRHGGSDGGVEAGMGVVEEREASYHLYSYRHGSTGEVDASATLPYSPSANTSSRTLRNVNYPILSPTIPTPALTVHPSPSSPRISTLLLDPPTLPPRSPTPVPGSTPSSSSRARRLSGVRLSRPPATDLPSFDLTALSPGSLPPLPATPNFAISKDSYPGGALTTPRSVLGHEGRVRSGGRLAYDVTTPRRFPVHLEHTPVGSAYTPVQTTAGGSNPSRIAYDVTSPRPNRMRGLAPAAFTAQMSISDINTPVPVPLQLPAPTAALAEPIPPARPINFGARQDSPPMTAHPERHVWEPDRLPHSSAQLLPPIPLTGAKHDTAHETTSSPRITLRLDSPRTPCVPAPPACISISTPTPPRPARRRYDAHSPLSSKSPHVVQAQMQPLPLALTSPAALDTSDTDVEARGEEQQTQRRLQQLKGLVQTIDFGQPWSASGISDSTAGNFEQAGQGARFDADPDNENSDGPSVHSATFPQPHVEAHVEAPERQFAQVHPDRPFRERPKVGSKVKLAATPGRPLAAVSQDHGWPSPATPVRAVHDTPPRPRQRSEVFDVASAGYNSSAPATPLARPNGGRRRPDDLTRVPSNTPTTWRSTLSNDLMYTRLYTVDPARVTRQEVMWEMCETEQVFLRSIRTVLRLFAIPVKTPQGKWIDGIPLPISELFDNLESIAHAHSVLCTSQRDMRRRAEVLDFDAFIAMLKNWTPRLAPAYEWYLCEFESVVALVEEHVRDPDSVFGEFVRMQLQDEALGSMSLGSMLLKPVQRLMKYPLFLKRLQEVNPRHPELLSLIGMMESIIHSLQATKAREDEYRQLKMLESRLTFPVDMDTNGFRLATRDRKLLGTSTVVRLTPAQMSMPVRSSIASSTSSATTSCYFSQPGHSQIQTPSRQSSFSASSVSSGPSRSGSLRMSMSMSMGMSLPMSPGRDKLYRIPSMISMNGNNEYPTSPGRSRSKGRKDELTLFVFDDLVIMAQSHEKGGLFTSKTKKERGWRVLSEAEGGWGRVVGVREWQGPIPCFLLTILPLNPALASACVCISVPTPREPASPSFAPTGKRAANGLMADVKTFSSMQQLMQALQDTQTVDVDGGDCGKEELMSSMSVDAEGDWGRGGSSGDMHEVQSQGDVIYTSEGIGDDHPLFSLRAMGY